MTEEIVYDLKAKVYQNRNPEALFTIPNINYNGWHNFQNFIRSQATDKTPILKQFKQAEQSINGETPLINTQAGQEISKKLIEEFNSTQKFDNTKLTEANIIAIQTFHNITDNNVKIDGWIGTQTRQLIIPYAVGWWTQVTNINANHWVTKLNGDQISERRMVYGKEEDGWWLPVQFGNKRYVLKSKDSYDQKENNIRGLYKPLKLEQFKKYNPDVHKKIEFINYDFNNKGTPLNFATLNLKYLLDKLEIPFRYELLLDYNGNPFNPIWDFEQNTGTQRDANNEQIGFVLPAHDEDVKSKEYFTTEQPPKPNPWPIPTPIPTIPQRLRSSFYKKAEVDFINGILIPKVITLLS